jgi:hypothetical protein
VTARDAAASDEAYAIGRASVDDQQAEANARKARKRFRVIAGGHAPKVVTAATPRSRARRKPGGAA